MKFNATIFVEGKSDKQFISQFLQHSFNVVVNPLQIVNVEGKDNLKGKLEDYILLLQESSDQELMNLIIFDADDSFASRLQSITDSLQKLDVVAKIFLLPNNKESGDLEVLLERIITNENQFIFDCFKDYILCLEKSNSKLNLPAQKTKIHAYLDLKFASTKLESRDYLDSKLWNLESEHLKPLKEFIQPYIVS
jgi:hypothetical protein